MPKFLIYAVNPENNADCLFREVEWPVVPRVEEEVELDPDTDLTPVSQVFHHVDTGRIFVRVEMLSGDDFEVLRKDSAWRRKEKLRKSGGSAFLRNPRKFEISPEEETAASAWFREHQKKCAGAKSATELPPDVCPSFPFFFIFEMDAVSYGVSVQCKFCNETQDVTDYSSW
ncbi:hypothetical protein KGQ25_02770 [Patescibacteria group bacterium]|nr:hypothetical protein [Patescibacteria group bacterium]